VSKRAIANAASITVMRDRGCLVFAVSVGGIIYDGNFRASEHAREKGNRNSGARARPTHRFVIKLIPMYAQRL